MNYPFMSFVFAIREFMDSLMAQGRDLFPGANSLSEAISINSLLKNVPRMSS